MNLGVGLSVILYRQLGASGFDRIEATLRCEPWILVGHVKNGKQSNCKQQLCIRCLSRSAWADSDPVRIVSCVEKSGSLG